MPEAHAVVRARRCRHAGRRAAGLEGARRAARGGLAGGARCDRPHVGERAPGSGLDLLVRPRARRAGRADGARAYYLRISGQPNFYGLLAAEELGAMAGVPEPFHVPSEAEVAAAQAQSGPRARARALPARPAHRGDARMGVHHPRHGRRAAAGGRGARAPRAASSTARSTPPTAPCTCTTTRCATSRRSRTCSANTRAAPGWRRPGCSGWCARKAASSSTRSPRPARAG